MTDLTYVGSARAWSTNAYDGVTVERGETVAIEDEEFAAYLVEHYDFEESPVDDEPDASTDDYPPEFAILDETVPEVEAKIETGAFDGQLSALEAIESEMDDRKGVHEAIDERRDALAAGTDGTDDE